MNFPKASAINLITVNFLASHCEKSNDTCTSLSRTSVSPFLPHSKCNAPNLTGKCCQLKMES